MQIIELKRFGGAPHHIQFAPLVPPCFGARERAQPQHDYGIGACSAIMTVKAGGGGVPRLTKGTTRGERRIWRAKIPYASAVMTVLRQVAVVFPD
jgi:hypothetical protein